MSATAGAAACGFKVPFGDGWNPSLLDTLRLNFRRSQCPSYPRKRVSSGVAEGAKTQNLDSRLRGNDGEVNQLLGHVIGTGRLGAEGFSVPR